MTTLEVGDIVAVEATVLSLSEDGRHVQIKMRSKPIALHALADEVTFMRRVPRFKVDDKVTIVGGTGASYRVVHLYGDYAMLERRDGACFARLLSDLK